MPGRLIDLGESESLIVVSDVHLRSPEDERTQQFCAFLDRIGNDFKCDTLVLLGDIFDFLNARQRFYYELWRDVFERLRQLDSRGVKVVFVEGNHDYGFEHGTCREIKNCFFECGDFVVKLTHSRLGEIVLIHSDDVVCPPTYPRFRRVVKSKTFQTLLSPVPGWLTSALFSRYARVSRAKDDYRPLDPDFLTHCSSQFIDHVADFFGLRPRVCVFGHIHVHLDDHLRDVRFLSGPAWFTSANALTVSPQGEIERKWLTSEPTPIELFRFVSTRASLT